MKPESLKTAIAEAKRFLEKASKVEPYTWEDYTGKKHPALKQGVATASLRRASLDLTRALSNLRRYERCLSRRCL